MSVCVCVCVCVIVMLGYIHFAKLHFNSFDYAHFAKTYLYNGPCFSPFCKSLYVHELWLCRPFCKNLCWRSSSTETHFAKAHVDFLWLRPFCKRLVDILWLCAFCKNLCRRCCCCCCEAAKSINYMVQSYCAWIIAELCTKQKKIKRTQQLHNRSS